MKLKVKFIKIPVGLYDLSIQSVSFYGFSSFFWNLLPSYENSKAECRKYPIWEVIHMS